MKKTLSLVLALVLFMLVHATLGYSQQQQSDTGGASQTAAVNLYSPDRPVKNVTTSIFDIYNQLQASIAKATSGVFGGFMGSFGTLAIGIAALYIAITAIRMIRGDVEHIKEALTTMFLLAVISNIIFNTASWTSWVVEPILQTITGTSNFLVSKATGGATGDIQASMFDATDKIMSAVTQMGKSSSIWDTLKNFDIKFASFVAQIAVSVAIFTITVTYLLILLLNWFKIYILLGIGGVWMFFAAFKSTRHIFWAWLRAVANYGLVVVFASLVMGVCIGIIGEQASAFATQNFDTVDPLFNQEFIALIIACVITWCFLLQAPDLAAALSGGSAGNTAGIAGVVSMGAGALYGGAKWVAGRSAAGGILGQHIGASPGGGALGAAARGAGRLARGVGLGPSARKGIDNSSY